MIYYSDGAVSAARQGVRMLAWVGENEYRIM